jgi:hypothetical protein
MWNGMGERNPVGIFPFSLFPSPKKTRGGSPYSTNSLSPPFHSVGMRIAVWMDHTISHLSQISGGPNSVALRIRKWIRTVAKSKNSSKKARGGEYLPPIRCGRDGNLFSGVFTHPKTIPPHPPYCVPNMAILELV